MVNATSSVTKSCVVLGRMKCHEVSPATAASVGHDPGRTSPEPMPRSVFVHVGVVPGREHCRASGGLGRRGERGDRHQGGTDA